MREHVADFIEKEILAITVSAVACTVVPNRIGTKQGLPRKRPSVGSPPVYVLLLLVNE